MVEHKKKNVLNNIDKVTVRERKKMIFESLESVPEYLFEKTLRKIDSNLILKKKE